jgi:glycine/D-amino acid oxidase-like deaminating enzyme
MRHVSGQQLTSMPGLLWGAAGITFKTGCKVVSADLAAKALTLDTGDTLSYEHLVIATGARVSGLLSQRRLTQSGQPLLPFRTQSTSEM